MSTAPHIGTLAETSLHAALKAWYARPGDQIEAPVGGYVIDIVRDDGLIEIQTRHVAAIKRKLERLLPDHTVCLVLPIAREKWIVRQNAHGQPLGRRKSPRRGNVLDAFYELVRIPHLLPHPNLTVEIALTREEEIWRDDQRGSWRRKRWSVHDRRLLDVVETRAFAHPIDFCGLLPSGLPQPFSNRELADALPCQLALAQKLTYTLQRAHALDPAGKAGNALLFARAEIV